MKKVKNAIKVSRIQYKLQTDGYYSGNPSVFVELFGCNLKCPKLNDRKLGELPLDYEDVSQIDTGRIQSGCDHIHAHDSNFFYLARRMDIEQICEEIWNALPDGSWVAKSGKPIHLVFTGGEPLLQQKVIQELLQKIDYTANIERKNSVSYITIETNCTLALEPEFAKYLKLWEKNVKYLEEFKREVLFSNSPKLPSSGETIPINNMFEAYFTQVENQFKSTFKFPVKPKAAAFEEVDFFFKELFEINNSCILDPVMSDNINHKLRKTLVYISHEASNRDQVDFADLRKINLFCLQYGYIMSLRSHLFWGI